MEAAEVGESVGRKARRVVGSHASQDKCEGRVWGTNGAHILSSNLTTTRNASTAGDTLDTKGLNGEGNGDEE